MTNSFNIFVMFFLSENRCYRRDIIDVLIQCITYFFLIYKEISSLCCWVIRLQGLKIDVLKPKFFYEILVLMYFRRTYFLIIASNIGK